MLKAREEQLQQEDAQRRADYEARELQLAKAGETLEKNQSQYLADLARLDRLQAAISQRQQQLQECARETDRQFEQLQRASRELEEQARHLSQWHDKLRGEATRLAQQKDEQDAAAKELAKRAEALEGQQAMLASLRTRLERLREELSRDEQRVAEQQARVDASEAELQQKHQEAQRLRTELDSEKELGTQERRRFQERQSTLEAAVAQLRQAQETLTAREKEVEERGKALQTAAATQEEKTRQLQAESEQLHEMQQRFAADRQALREREASLAQLKHVREALQEQLRRRAEELATRQQGLTEQARQQDDLIAALAKRQAEIEQERGQAESKLTQLREELHNRGAELDRRQDELTRRAEQLQRQVEQIKQVGRKIGAAKKVLREERTRWLAAEREAQEAAAQTTAELETTRQGLVELQQQLPELMLQAQAAAERLTQARGQLREHLQELHSYADQSQEAIEALRSQAQLESGQVREQQQALHRGREEHRLAVAAFRQQLIEWQGQLAEMKRSLAQGETRLERRQAQVDQQARQIDATSTRLAQQAEQLQSQARLVAERRQEIERHLHDMREWYRSKLRELSLVREKPVPHEILTLNREVEPADRKLGDLLLSLDLVEDETLATLLAEAQRQHRSLRQALLAGGYLTLYQMALIETGNVDGLVLGPLRVIDRLRATACEAVYRVFDPRRNHEALLRHLAESEMDDAVHPDEFRQRFGQAAAVQHPQVAATLELLEINGRPGVLLEWLTGLPGSDWPALAAVPGVWFRLLNQAALGLHAAHEAGLVHGHLEPGSFVLNGEGGVKLCGLGEPRWLRISPHKVDAPAKDLTEHQEESIGGDLAELGRIAAGWAVPALRHKGPKGLFPKSLQTILERLVSVAESCYPSAAVLLEDLERVRSGVPAHAQAWERLLQQARAQSAEDTILRQSA